MQKAFYSWSILPYELFFFRKDLFFKKKLENVNARVYIINILG